MMRAVSNRDDLKEQIRSASPIGSIIGEYLSLTRTGSDLVGLCPFHDDHDPSLHVDPDKGLFHCFSCNAGGDVFAFVMKREGSSFPEALEHLAAKAGMSTKLGLTLEDLATAKNLPLEFLQGLGLTDVRRGGQAAVAIPYLNQQGRKLCTRHRFSFKLDPRFKWQQGSKVALYGLHRLKEARQKGYLLLLEGESDCWTAWHCGLPALGIPGKDMWKSAFDSDLRAVLEGIEVYLWIEPGADNLIADVAADLPEVKVIPAASSAKDLSAAYLAGMEIVKMVDELRQRARSAMDIVDEQKNAALVEFRERAAPVFAASEPLDLITEAIQGLGYGGDLTPPTVVYVAATTRLLGMRQGAMPCHLLLLGPASAGKSHTLQTVMRLLPSEAVHVIDASSPRALIYDEADLQHRMVVFSEADSLPAGEDNPAASAVRNLLQDHHLHYKATIRHPQTGAWTVRDVAKPGPTMMATTSTKPLGDQLQSRMFILELPDDQAQVRAALRSQALIELHGGSEPSDALIAYQQYLQALAPWEVSVPFAVPLAEALGKVPPGSRITRDFARLISFVKAVAVLRHPHGEKDDRGRLVATPADYEKAYDLLADIFVDSADGITEKTRSAVQAVADLGDAVTVAAVAKKLNINNMAASRRVGIALQDGWLRDENASDGDGGKGKSKSLVIGIPLPAKTGLPTPETITMGGAEDTYNTITSSTGRYPAPISQNENGQNKVVAYLPVDDVIVLYPDGETRPNLWAGMPETEAFHEVLSNGSNGSVPAADQ